MQMRREIHFGLRLNKAERAALARLAEAEGLSESATLRRLLRRAVRELTATAAAPPFPEVPHEQPQA